MAVADIRAIAGEGAANRGEGLTELLNIGLLESAPVRMTSREYLYDLRRRMFGSREGPLGPDEALAVSRRAGIAYLLAGQLITDGKGDLATWRLIEVESGANIAANQVRGDSWTELADGVIRGAVTALTGHLGSDEPIIPVTVADLTTTYPEAYEAFVAGQVHLRNLQYEAARQSLTSAVDIDSTFALAHFSLSRIYSNVHGGIGDGRLTAQHAEKAWRHRTRLGRKDRLRVKAWRAQLGYRMTEVRETFAEMHDQWPDDRELLMDQLEFLHHHWYFREGLAVATGAVEFYEDDPAVLDYQQDLMAAMGESDKALEVARRLTTLVPDEVSYWQELGSRWLELADPDQAAAAARAALERDPDYLLGRIQLAQTRYVRGDLAGAVTAMETILADTSLGNGQRIMVLTSSSFRPSLTMLYGQAGRMRDALAAFDQAEALTGSPGTRRAIQGRRHRFLLRHGEYEAALEWAGEILAGEPGPSAWFNAAINGAVAYAQADSLTAARAVVDSLYGREASIGGLARFMARRGAIAVNLADDRPDSVLAVVADIRGDGLMPGGAFDLEIRLARARALAGSGQGAAAEEVLHDLLLVYGGCAPARLELALVLQANGKPREALAACEEFLAAWSDADPEAPALAVGRRLKKELSQP
jgi:tetratricopeptide (TPR) repeat protein